MAVAAGIELRCLVTAVLTLLLQPAQGFSAALFDMAAGSLLIWTEWVMLAEIVQETIEPTFRIPTP
jgi:hypothetical protein